MGKVTGQDWLAAIAGAVPVIGGVLSQVVQSRSERREYDEAREYNTPANQMQRFREAGLSPYLMYSQGTPGNVTEARPPKTLPVGGVGEGIDKYLGMVNLQNERQRLLMERRLFPAVLSREFDAASIAAEQRTQATYQTMRDGLELFADFPGIESFDAGPDRRAAAGGFRAQANELKRALAEANVEKMKQLVQNLKYRNQVDKVKGSYAEDYGMVGGDWTQGLGLLRSLGSGFRSLRSGAKAVDPQSKALLDAYRKFKGDQYKRDANRFLFEQLKH